MELLILVVIVVALAVVVGGVVVLGRVRGGGAATARRPEAGAGTGVIAVEEGLLPIGLPSPGVPGSEPAAAEPVAPPGSDGPAVEAEPDEAASVAPVDGDTASEEAADLGAGGEGALEELVKPSFRERLGKARSLLAGYLGSIRSRGVDEETWEELEEALIRADVGVEQTMQLLDRVRETARAEGVTDADGVLDLLKAEVSRSLQGRDRDLRLDEGTTNVWLFVGVNGVGKTTTIGKVGRQQKELGRRCLMAAGDTFRAAAAEQLETWAERAGADFVRGGEGADPAAVVHDGVERASARGYDLVLADTAGRLHTKTNLMDELRKVRRVADREPGNVTEVLLVLDAVTGQNGLVQAKEFAEAVEVTGVVLTKLDGSAKGGIVLAIEQQLGIPVKLVGLGETVGDLVAFEPDEFVEALFAT